MDSKQLVVQGIYNPPTNNILPIPREKRDIDNAGTIHVGYVLEVDNDILLVKSILKGKNYRVLPHNRRLIGIPVVGEFVELLPYLVNYNDDYKNDPTTGINISSVKEVYRYKDVIDLYNNSILNQAANPDNSSNPPSSPVDDNYNIIYNLNEGDTLLSGRLGNGILFSFDNSDPITHIFNQTIESSSDEYSPELRGIILENELIHIEEKVVSIISEEYTVESDKINLVSDSIIISGDSESAALGDSLNELLGEIIDLFDPSAAVPQDGGKIMMTVIQTKAKILKAKSIQTKKILSKTVKLK